MTDLFEKIRIEVETNPDGWATVEKAQTLAALIVAIKPEVVCELGIWSGRSLIPMALALAHNKKGKIVGVDPWSKAASMEGLEGDHLKWWSTVDHDLICSRFGDRLQASGAVKFCEIYRCKSNEIEWSKVPTIDLLHLDANHSEKDSCYDVKNVASKVRSGGFLFMDDIFWASKANEMLKSFGFLEMYKMDTGAFYQRI